MEDFATAIAAEPIVLIISTIQLSYSTAFFVIVEGITVNNDITVFESTSNQTIATTLSSLDISV